MGPSHRCGGRAMEQAIEVCDCPIRGHHIGFIASESSQSVSSQSEIIAGSSSHRVITSVKKASHQSYFIGCIESRRLCRTVTLQQQKRQTYSEPRTERVEWDISVANVNVNVLINFTLLVMQRQVSVGKEIPHCNIEMYTYCYIFPNVLGKKTRRWKAKSHTYSLRIPCGIQTVRR